MPKKPYLVHDCGLPFDTIEDLFIECEFVECCRIKEGRTVTVLEWTCWRCGNPIRKVISSPNKR